MESVISSQDEGSGTESQQDQASDPSEKALLQVQQALDRLDCRSAIELASQVSLTLMNSLILSFDYISASHF